jgi:hypothetical protein
MKDQLNITIKLADIQSLTVTVHNTNEEEEAREAAKYVNRVWARWMEEASKTRTSKDVLAMVAFHFAKLYLRESIKNSQVDEFLKEFNDKLDRALDISDKVET